VGGGDCAYPPQWFTASAAFLLKFSRAPPAGSSSGPRQWTWAKARRLQFLIPRLKQPTTLYTPPPTPPTAPPYFLCPVWLFCVYFLGCFLVECVYDLFAPLCLSIMFVRFGVCHVHVHVYGHVIE